MQLYSITAIDDHGKKIKKLIEMDDNEDVTSYMDSLGANIISVKKLPSFYRHLKPKKKIKTQDVIEVLDNLHLIVKAGLPINTALNDLAADADNPEMRNVLDDVARRVHTGLSFSKALSKHEKIFGEITINLVRIGEETGQLDSTIKDAAEHIKKISDLISKTKSALIYPSFALVAMMGTMIFWLVVVMPKMIDAFKSFQIELPPTTRFIMAMSDFLQSYLLHIVVLSVAAFFLHGFLRRTNEKYRYVTDKLLTKMPIFGNVVRYFNFAFIAEYIRLMIAAGLPLYMALSIMEDSLKNLVYKKSIIDTRDLISVGKSFSAALGEQKMYPNIILRMVNIGEQTGNLDSQLENVAQYYYQKVDYIATNISKMMEPLIIGFIGIFMLIIMIGLMGPIFSLITNMPT
ncbi:MAG: type II secretion system F family protein [Denitrovibrio sp.]|nr:MAG: type II secretion system F family protein [Denitrovibrio sp.]